MLSITPEIIKEIVRGEYHDVFAVLGPHAQKNGYVIRAFFPAAKTLQVKSKLDGSVLAEAVMRNEEGFFEANCNCSDKPSYYFTVGYGDKEFDVEDMYRFGSTIPEGDLYLFGEGTYEQAYRLFGAHPIEVDGVPGCRFTVWAPNAKTVAVVGDFNFWQGRAHVMRKHIPSGIWELFIPYLGEGALYKYEIRNHSGDCLPHKADPYGFAAQKPPEQASVVSVLDRYEWNDAEWFAKANNWTQRDRPISIYEVHLGSWKRVVEEDNRYLSYKELAADLIPYVKSMGFTHIQLMPISEFPFDGSWGYQPVGLYAPTSRFGSPEDFKYFVDCCHQNDLAVLIDWVPGHFPTDSHGLGLFDGTPLYEHADSRQGFHPDWNTYIYNYGRHEVKSFLMANALFWLEQYHIDGLRVDAVASMLYLDYSRKDGEWLPNSYGGRENLEAIDFLRLVNERVYKRFPHAMMVAEESTAWPGVSSPTSCGGLGFGYKWNMGWMNDSLQYISKEPIHRQYHHHDMTFSLHYAFSENFVLPLSHDEVVHGKRSLLGRMPGDAWQQFANLRAYYAFMWTHPGKKLLFMGGEFAQGMEWNHDTSLSWHQLEIDFHSGIQTLVKSLNRLYTDVPALYKEDCMSSGFEWVEADDRHNSIFAFLRKAKDEKPVLVVANFTPVAREGYRVGVNQPGYYRELLNTDSELFGGSNLGNEGGIHTEEIAWHQRPQSVSINIPALAAVVFQLDS